MSIIKLALYLYSRCCTTIKEGCQEKYHSEASRTNYANDSCQKLLGPTVAQSLMPTSLHICGREIIRGKIFSREDNFARGYFREKIFSREDIFA